MRPIITVNGDKCIGCNACVRVCPVHATVTKLKEGTDDQFVTSVDNNACINCGECVKACTHGAREYEDDIDVFEAAIKKGNPIVIITEPAIRTNFPKGKWRTLLSWLRSKGNCKIYDAGFGADICTYMHHQYLLKHPDAKILTQPCPAAVSYVQKYKPELLPNLSPVLSPAGCMAAYLRKYKHVTEPMFLLSPCIAKLEEAERDRMFDYNVTFRRLEKFANRNGINWKITSEFEYDDSLEGSIGLLYPTPGGMKDTLLMMNQDLVIRTAEGPRTLYDRIDRYYQTEDRKKPDVLDILNCEFGCNHGTAVASTVSNLMEVENAMDNIAALTAKETQGGLLGFGKMKRFKEFDKTLRLEDFLTTYKDMRVSYVAPTVADYNRIFHTMLKDDGASQNINCSACGYKSCHDMACAIYRGMNVRENCVYYLKRSLKGSYSQLRDIYDTVVEDISMMKDISQEMKNSQEEVVTSTDDISHKAGELSSNIQRLQKFSQSCLNYYKGRDAENMTAEDFAKMQQFISAIGTMSQSYYDVAKEFEERSESIHEQLMTFSQAVDALSDMANTLQTTIEENDLETEKEKEKVAPSILTVGDVPHPARPEQKPVSAVTSGYIPTPEQKNPVPVMNPVPTMQPEPEPVPVMNPVPVMKPEPEETSEPVPSAEPEPDTTPEPAASAAEEAEDIAPSLDKIDLDKVFAQGISSGSDKAKSVYLEQSVDDSFADSVGDDEEGVL